VTIFITAIGGFLGSSLAAGLARRGHRVKGSIHSSRAAGTPDVVRLTLDEPFDAAVFAGCDAVVHGAHDFTKGAYERNVRGTIAWAEAATEAGVARQLFIGSPSAQPNAPSEYGRVKYTLEQWFLDRWFVNAGHLVVRPGLVIGSGGLFARQRAALLRTPVVPLIGGGAQPTLVIGIDHFVEAVARIIETGTPREASLFYDDCPPMRRFVTAVKQAAGQRGIVVTIPSGIAIGLTRLGRALRLPIPVTPDQIRTLLHQPSPPPHGDLRRVLPDRTAEFSLAHALAAAEQRSVVS
jgi:nucleoside-diphosphate-sugar epimerase